jgi:hypothetical protein
MLVRWNEEKNQLLKTRRNVSFEQILLKLEAGDFLGPEQNPTYPGQFRIIINIDGYPHIVPFVIGNDGSWFLKTIFPSRKQKRRLE